jgi:NAD(P)H-quinone oxidoreductase subunit 5
MCSTVVWLAGLGPLALFATAVLPIPANRSGAALARNASMAAALLTLGIALASTLATVLDGPLRTPLVGTRGIGFGLYLDSLSATMFCLVSFIGVIVVAYSRNYLDGDPHQTRFMRLLCATLAAVLLVILSGNLFAFALAWIATSLGLNALLLFYPERSAARLAARKEAVVSRLGDFCLIVAIRFCCTGTSGASTTRGCSQTRMPFGPRAASRSAYTSRHFFSSARRC